MFADMLLKNKYTIMLLPVIALIILVGFFSLFMGKKEKKQENMQNIVPEEDMKKVDEVSPTVPPFDYYLLDDGENREKSTLDNHCSLSCCSTSWPVGHMKRDEVVEELKKKGELVQNNYYCTSPMGEGGCMCLTKQQADHISRRGQALIQ